MSRSLTKRLSVVLAMFPAMALAGSEGQPFHGEASVNVIEVPVRVFDASTGKPVTGLEPDDFRVFEGDAEQEITNFYEIGAGATGRSTSPVADRAVRTRQLVYFFDLFLMMPGDRDRAVEAMEREYANGPGPDEEVSVVSFDGTLRTHVDRSRDRRRIARALEEVRSIRARGLDQRVAFTDALSDRPPSNARDLNFYERRQRSREYMFELERRVSQVGDALTSTLARYARADGRKALVAFTPGQPATSWAPSYAGVDFLYGEVAYPGQHLWENVALEAADLGFTLFIADSSGIGFSASGGATEGTKANIWDAAGGQTAGQGVNAPGRINPEGGNPTTGAATNTDSPADLGSWIEHTRKSMLISAAEVTGGEALFTSNVGVALDGVEEQLGHWYSIAYAVDHEGDGKTHDIKVEVRGHPEYRLVHRRSYVDRPSSQREAEGMRSAMLFGADANPLGIRVDFGDGDSRFKLGAAGSKMVKIPVVVKIPIGRLDMIPRGDVFWGKVLITLFETDATGNQSQIASHLQPITVPTEEFHKAVTGGYFAYRVTIEIEGGRQTVYVGVKDQISGKMSVVRYSP